MTRYSLLAVTSLWLLTSAALADAPADSTPPGVTQSWLDAVKRDINAREYQFSAAVDGAYSAPNRALDLRSRVAAAGVRVVSRTKGEEAFKLELRLARAGREGSLADMPAGKAELRGERVEIRRVGLQLVEWYTNDARGLEQGFTITARPAGDDSSGRPFVLELASGGSLRPIQRPQDGRIVFVDAAGASRLFYGGLVARDATGKELESRLAVANGRVQIRVSDEGAAYPVTIDPVIQPASWSQESNVNSGLLGTSVATAGDVNGDGFSDVIVGSPGELSNTGKAYLYLGHSTGLDTIPIWTGQGSAAGDNFGAAVAAAGNVDGDSFGDVVIGAPNAGVGGYIRVYHGSLTGVLVSPVTLTQSNCFSAPSATHFGASVATAGDVDGDGLDDVIVGEPGIVIDPLTRSGAVCIYRGVLGTGPSAGSKWVITAPTTAPTDQSFLFGASVSTAGDVNGDGIADVIIGAPAAHTVASGATSVGAAYVYLGSGSPGVGPVVPAVSVLTGDLSSDFGSSVANAGDMNGDGFADVLVGAPHDNGFASNAGAAYIFLGSSTGIATTPGLCGYSTVPARYCEVGLTANARLGASVATAGDLNGDGYADAVFGMPGWSYTGGTGGLYLVYGKSDGGYITATSEIITTGTFGNLSESVATAGDTDGDGFSEVLAGAPYFTNGQTFEGLAALFKGSGNPPQTVTAWNFSASNSGRIGDSIATADVNGDGRWDIIVGAPGFDSGLTDQGAVFVFNAPQSVLSSAPPPSPSRFYLGSAAGAELGQSVANAGDINDDGFEDVVVGAPAISHAYLFLGSASGLPVLASQDLPAPNAGTRFGQSVAGAGDVDGDGLGDVVIGAPLDETSAGLADEGVARLYLGTGSGALVASTWSAHSGQAGAQFGAVVAGVGDVNGDGFSDVLVSAPAYSAQFGIFGTDIVGLVQLFKGGDPAGLVTTPAWTIAGSGTITHHSVLGADLGYLGDVDADGFSDLWIRSSVTGFGGATSVAVYRGQASGVPALLTSFVGLTAAGGDVNGDGKSDLVVGDSGALAVKVFAGPLTSPTPIWTKTGAANSEFGARVATGDVNGDAVSDVLIGAPAFDNSFPDAGQVSLFLGNLLNFDDGIAVTPFQVDGACFLCIVRRVSLLGRPTSSPQNFFLSASAKSPAGSALLRLQSEVKPLGSLLDGIGIVSSAPIAAIGASPVGMSSSTFSLPPGPPLHWRLRIASSNPFFPNSRWISLAGNGPNESDLRGPADRDSDGHADTADNCPTLANADQADADFDGVGDACDNCVNAANPRVTPDSATYLSANSWATLTGGQRDDDHDGYGNRCDAKFSGTGLVGNTDVGEVRAANNKARSLDQCGPSGARPCAIYDLNETDSLIGAGDTGIARQLANKLPGPKCPSCPLPCEAGSAGTCGAVP